MARTLKGFGLVMEVSQGLGDQRPDPCGVLHSVEHVITSMQAQYSEQQAYRTSTVWDGQSSETQYYVSESRTHYTNR
jgi:hypothetical protein